MFPDVNGLRQSIDANTAVQREVLLLLHKLESTLREHTKALQDAAKATKDK